MLFRSFCVVFYRLWRIAVLRTEPACLLAERYQQPVGRQFASSATNTNCMCHLVLLLLVYGAGEAVVPSVSSRGIADRLRAEGHPCRLCEGEEDALSALGSLLREGDVLLTLGAGSVSRLGGLFLSGGGTKD